MSVARISAPKGIVPYICHSLENIIAQGFTIRKITMEVFSYPFVEEQENLVCYHEFKGKVTTFFNNPNFNTDAFLAVLVHRFKGCTKDLQKAGCFARLICKATVESTRDPGTGIPHVLITKIRSRREGCLTSTAWEEDLFSTALEDSLNVQLINNVQALNLLGL